jgi:myosin heavy subunit
MIKIGFSESETITIYKITQAVLLIGNFTFQSVDNAKEYNKISSTDILKDVCDLLEVDMKEFEYRIVSKTTIVGKDVSVSKLDIKFCQNE